MCKSGLRVLRIVLFRYVQQPGGTLKHISAHPHAGFLSPFLSFSHTRTYPGNVYIFPGVTHTHACTYTCPVDREARTSFCPER